ncbi:AAA family ATPase [Pseudomonas sp. IT-P171]|uniref:AAA family ATPase n=1 Tax=Pseudomonas sp. IT-P171 TaxID=3026453 RepID=UPI0039E1418D
MSYITELNVSNVRNLRPFTLTINSKKNIIVTGKNGSGKTTLLEAIRDELSSRRKYGDKTDMYLTAYSELCKEAKTRTLTPQESEHQANLAKMVGTGGIKISLHASQRYLAPDEIFVCFSSRRTTEAATPKGPQIIAYGKQEDSTPNYGKNFIQYLVNLWTEKSYAREDNDLKRVAELDEWFTKFSNQLRKIFEDSALQLEFDRKIFNFWIVQPGKDRYSLNELSDGLSSAINIVSELILRMDQAGNASFDASGIVIIDEIENHLHVSLQKIILPFLSSLFPNIQFVASTHSPFVLISDPNTCIIDLTKNEIHEDFSAFSYEAIIEDYFNVDKYSYSLKNRVEEIRGMIRRQDYTQALAQIDSVRDDAKLNRENATDTSGELVLALGDLELDIKSKTVFDK